jgi:hypothetical protein
MKSRSENDRPSEPLAGTAAKQGGQVYLSRSSLVTLSALASSHRPILPPIAPNFEVCRGYVAPKDWKRSRKF